MILGAAALFLIFFGQRLGWVNYIESSLSVVATPFYALADIPERLGGWSDENVVSREQLIKDNRQLRAEAFLLKAKVQKLAALEAENERIRQLLNSSALLDETVLVAELIGVSPDPLHHQIIINKGIKDNLFVGQPVLDAEGLMGQVIKVGASHSRVLLITDATHAIPVQVNRNGVRSIAEGVGVLHELTLRHVSATTDIKVGDLLVSSGLGGRFPQRYPVAEVIEVTIDPGQPFAIVRAKPRAQLDRSRHVLLVFNRQPVED